MAWNAANPVPWKRLCLEWLVVGTVVGIISLVTTDKHNAGSYLAIFFAGFFYVGLGALLAKFGYQRKTLRQIRAAAAAAPVRQVGRSAGAVGRPRPVATNRTGSAPRKSQPKRRK